MTSRAFEATWPEELPRSGHCTFFHSQLAQLRWAMVPFFLKGLREGAACTFYTSQAKIQQVGTWLEEAGVPVRDLIASGQLSGFSSLGDAVPTSAAEVLQLLTTLYRPRLEHYPAIYHVGDALCPGLPQMPTRLFIEVECRFNQEFAGLPIKTLCVFDIPRLDGQTLLHLLQTHPLNLTEESVQRNPYVPPDKFLKRFLHA